MAEETFWAAFDDEVMTVCCATRDEAVEEGRDFFDGAFKIARFRPHVMDYATPVFSLDVVEDLIFCNPCFGNLESRYQDMGEEELDELGALLEATLAEWSRRHGLEGGLYDLLSEPEEIGRDDAGSDG